MRAPIRRYGARIALAATVAGVILVTWLAAVVPPRLALVTPAPSVLFEDAEGRYLAERSTDGAQHGFWPPAGPLPDKVVLATMAAEDVRFESHHGVDLRSVLRACWQNARSRRVVQGASTLAMQVARLQDPGGRSLPRKLVEACVALGLTHRFGRDALLRHYLTIAPYGNQNHGIVYAARRYLNKPLADLTWAEAALLASLPRLPGRMNLYRPRGWERAERRARHVLTRLKEVGWISSDDFERAVTQVPLLRLLEKEKRPASALHAILAIEREHRARPLGGSSTRNIVRTTLDLDLQRALSELAAKRLPGLRDDGAGNLAMVVVDRATGGVKGYLGSGAYGDVRHKGSIDYARVLRSPGSALKPFVFALGMWRKGYTAATLLTDVGLILDPKKGGYSIKNYDGGFLGPVLYRNALANSRNIPAIEVLEAVGVETALEHFGDLGLVTRWKDPEHYGLSLALGSMHVTLFDLVRAYGVLANDGRSFAMRWAEAGPGAKPASQAPILPEEVARQITLFLSDPMARLPSFPRLGWLEYPFPVAVKTGTSQGYRDAWCVAYSKRWLVGAWVGHPDNFPMKRRSGADSAAMLVHEVMEHLHPAEMEGLDDRGFPPPRGYVARRVDLLSGKAAREDTPYVGLEWFAPGTEPTESTDVYQEVTIDLATGLEARADCPVERRQRKRFVRLEPRFARWAKLSGFELPPVDPADPLAHLKKDPELTIVTPCAEMRLRADPEVPAAQATIALEATVDPPSPQVVWYVDGEPLTIADYPYTTRWRITPGDHVLQIGLPYAPVRSPPVKVKVLN